MPDEKSDAEMRLLMLQIAEVEKNAPGKYPDYKRGIIAGTAVLAAALLAGMALIAFILALRALPAP